ncbi:hypothetical protein ACCI51_18265 [Microbulbifer echini]|uniref:Uncharacterized protein n=1 Tax=Microbulbifer echini TaxID=1529067 RepID=A0ABV4NSV7_9GAMM
MDVQKSVLSQQFQQVIPTHFMVRATWVILNNFFLFTSLLSSFFKWWQSSERMWNFYWHSNSHFALVAQVANVEHVAVVITIKLGEFCNGQSKTCAAIPLARVWQLAAVSSASTL